MEKNDSIFKRWMRFDRPDGAFELLETERGEPKFWDGRDNATEEPKEPPVFVSASLDENVRRLKTDYSEDINKDVILRSFSLGGRMRAVVVFFDGMADADQINHFILRQGMRGGCMDDAEGDIAQYAVDHVFAMQEVELTDQFSDLKTAVGEGRSAVLIDGCARAIVMDTRGFPTRSVKEPQNETVVLGPHEAFTENIRTNISLIRRIIRTEDLVFEFREAGGKNKTKLAVAYRSGVANPSLVNEVKRRLASVDTLMILASGMLEQLTEERPFAPLPQTQSTERPDRTAAALMQGQVAVIVDGSPIVNILPVTLFSLMSSAEDTYLRQPTGTIMRVVRYAGAVVSILMPSLFVALALHHQGMLSTEVLATVASSRSMVFLPLALEMIFLQLVFQLIREAGLAVPGVLGQSVGIIGGLIMGQAAVAANLVSTVVLIIVALSGLGNFTIPDYRTQLAVAYFRMILVIAAWAGGLLGLGCTVLITMAWMASLKSYGVPFLSPASPKVHSDGPLIVRGRLQNRRRMADWSNAEGGRR